MGWLDRTLADCELDEECRGYVLGRGASPRAIREMGLTTWVPPETPIDDEAFVYRYGTVEEKRAGKSKGEKIEGWLICPLHSPQGRVIGFEARRTDRKAVSQFKLDPEAYWNPVLIGLKRALPAIWRGRDIWCSEGQFDLYPLDWVIPEGDANLASLTAHLTPAHVQFFWRASLLGCRVHMVYDNDESGRRGLHGFTDETGKERWGAIKSLNRVGVPCEAVSYGGGGDPGDIWDNGGVNAMRRAFRM
jgi:DNA primase